MSARIQRRFVVEPRTRWVLRWKRVWVVWDRRDKVIVFETSTARSACVRADDLEAADKANRAELL